MIMKKRTDVEGTRQFRNITYSNRLDLVAQLEEHWTSKPKVTVRFPPHVVKQTFELPGMDTLREQHHKHISSSIPPSLVIINLS